MLSEFCRCWGCGKQVGWCHLVLRGARILEHFPEGLVHLQLPAGLRHTCYTSRVCLQARGPPLRSGLLLFFWASLRSRWACAPELWGFLSVPLLFPKADKLAGVPDGCMRKRVSCSPSSTWHSSPQPWCYVVCFFLTSLLEYNCFTKVC